MPEIPPTYPPEVRRRHPGVRHCWFRPVGVPRRYERGADGRWRDGLLLDLLADDLTG
ncbi:hypothetical protein AB0B94_28285 [Micromonospora sp. NPDC048986]|uniref:hypothetical protein n=1 Tax=Micromonospora sp. NPDC048986 TaxID=3155644 RepID=UPI0033E58E13